MSKVTKTQQAKRQAAILATHEECDEDNCAVLEAGKCRGNEERAAVRAACFEADALKKAVRNARQALEAVVRR